uniref:PIPK domain-containing protein n=1 Tax=Hyaloperonospora arabidopsidis (strain Emoy2) TaxID=559515 RepID=M4B7W2_HYAAE
MVSRMSSNVGGLRESFFGAIGRAPTERDPLQLSPTHEFDLNVIQESGGMDETIGQILKPQVDFSKWSTEAYVVLGFGLVLLLLLLVLALTINTLHGYVIDPGLVFGSLLTLILCVCVFVTYHGVQSFQRHPNPLIYYKCVIDMCLALRFLLDPLLLEMGLYRVNDERSCAYLSGVTQFLYLSSDCWYFAQIVDMYWSLTNPFMSVKVNRKRFKIAVYSSGACTGIFLALVPSIHGFADGNYCWTKRKTSSDPVERDFYHLNSGSWVLFYVWMLIFYISGITVMAFGTKRLRSGLRDTLQSRREMLRNSALSIMSYTVYWTIVFLWYAVSFQTRTTYDKNGHFPPSHVFRAFTFTLSARGTVDYFVWFMVNSPSQIRANWLKFTSDSVDKQFSAQLNTTLQEELIYFTIEGMTRAVQVADEELTRLRDRSPTREVESSMNDDNDSRRSTQDLGEAATTATGLTGSGSSSDLLEGSQRNRLVTSIQKVISAGLRRTSSAVAEVRAATRKNSEETALSFDIPADQRVMHQPPIATHRTDIPSSTSTVASADSSSPEYGSDKAPASIRLTPYKPLAFAELRQAHGIKAADFLKSFQTSTKPKISEGASGAFMFFSGDKKYIVKSMAEEEARFLCKIAESYAEYLTRNPLSLLTKFYGCFKITIYDKRFYFIVMENLFDVMEEGVQIHHRFDIKGSWVNRSYKRPRRGAKVKCRHCSMMFRYGAKKGLLQCPNVVGLHEPNVVLKDNDLRTRMRIGVDEGVKLYEQLRDDSIFLCDLGIMDYSLLLGVMDIEFVVDQPSRPLASSLLSDCSAASKGTTNAETNVERDSYISSGTNDSFVSASSSNWSTASQIAAVLSSGNKNVADETTPTVSDKLTLRVAPSVHSLWQQPADRLNPSRSSPSAGGREPRPKRSMRKSQRVFGPGYYYVGIIDILQTWTLQKQLERFFKVKIQQKDGEGLSAIDPVQYQQRFESKLREIIAVPKEYYHIHRQQPKQSKRMTMFKSVQRLSPVLQAAAAFESAAAAQEARRQLVRDREDSTNTQTSGSSSNDLEQTGRNPEPILLQFNQRLLSTSSSCSQLNLADGAV